MSEVLFSFLQFKFAQCCTWVMNKITKHNGVHRVTNLHTSAYQDEQKTTFIYYSSYNVVVIIQDSHVSGWWFESKDGQIFFSDFLLSFFPYIIILTLHFYQCRLQIF